MTSTEILIVTADDALANSLRPLLEQGDRVVLTCRTIHEALQRVTTNDISYVILDLVLQGQDGRRLIMELRSDPATAAMPIVAIGPTPAHPESGLVHAADIYIGKPVNPAEVVETITRRLKRGHARGRKALRDSTTGLPNRAAFCEAYKQASADCAANKEPMALAFLGIHGYETLIQDPAASKPDELIRRVGSTLSTSFRSTDTVARWSQSEFAVLLPGETYPGANRAVEKALAVLNQLSFTAPDGREYPVAVCAGLIVLKEPTSLEDAVTQAERRLCESLAARSNSPASSGLTSETNPAAPRSEVIALCIADGTMGRAIAQMLERDGLTVTRFTSTEELLEAIAVTRFSLLIADDGLPVPGGGHLMQRIRALPSCARLRVVMLVADEASIVQALELGADEYAIKPLDITAFISRTRRLLSARGTAPSAREIMIIDHEIPQLLVSGTTLSKRCGYTVRLAHGTTDALQRMTTLVPDLVILDVDMPDDSLKTFLLKLPPNQDFEIITAAATSTKADELNPGRFRVRGHVTRPFKPDTLLKELGNLITLTAAPPKAKGSEPDAIDTEIRRVLTRRP